MITNLKPNKTLENIWLLITFTVGYEFFTRFIFLLFFLSVLGLIFLLRSQSFNKKELLTFIFIIAINLGSIISKLLFTSQIDTFINILFIIRNFAFLGFVSIFVSRYAIPKKTLLVISTFNIPHFILLLFSIQEFEYYDRLGGFYNDPNYLSMYLIFAISAQLYILLGAVSYSRRVQVFNNFNIVITIVALFMTSSRTGITSFFVLLIVLAWIYLTQRNRSRLIRFVVLPFTITLLLLFSNEIIYQSSRLQFIYDRFTTNDEGRDVINNERYIAWNITYETITSIGIFESYGREQFIEKKFRFFTHNAFLDAGLLYGAYTFYSHLFVTLIALVLCVKYLLYNRNLAFNSYSYWIPFIISEFVMLNFISVSRKFFYWYFIAICISVIINQKKLKRLIQNP